MIEVVMFDWDGTLVDSKAAIMASYRESTLEVLGREFPATQAEVQLVLPMRAQESFGMLAQNEEQYEALVDAYHRAYLRNSELLASAFPDSAPTLRELRERGLRIGVVTSKGRARVDSDAERYGLAGLVDAYVTGDVSAERKPHPGPVRDALAAFAVAPERALYVGDGPQDVLAGRGAGVTTVAAMFGFHTEEEIIAEQPDHVIHRLGELIGIVDGMSR